MTVCEDDWLADTAESNHTTLHQDWFSTLKSIDRDILLQIGDDSLIHAEGVGSIEPMAMVKGQWEPRTLQNMPYVPNLKKNSSSVEAVTSMNLKVTFDVTKVEVYSGRLVATLNNQISL